MHIIASLGSQFLTLPDIHRDMPEPLQPVGLLSSLPLLCLRSLPAPASATPVPKLQNADFTLNELYRSIMVYLNLSIYYLPVPLSTYLPIYLSICLCVYLSTQLSTYQSINLYLCTTYVLPMYYLCTTYTTYVLPMYYLCTYLPIYLSIYQSINESLSICLSIYRSIYLSIYPTS